MREMLVIGACVLIPALTIKGCLAYQEIAKMNEEIQTAHARGAKPPPPARKQNAAELRNQTHDQSRPAE